MIQRKLSFFRIFLGSVLGALVLVASAGATQALASAPHWGIFARSAPSYLQPGKKGEITAVIVNLGDASVTGTKGNPVVVTDTLPVGVKMTGPVVAYSDPGDEKGTLSVALSCEGLRCTYTGEVPPLLSLEVQIPVEATHTGALGVNEMTVEGANAPAKTATRELTGSEAATPFGIEHFELNAEEENGSADLQAGSHPFQLTTALEFDQTFALDVKLAVPEVVPGTPALLKNVDTTLPAGLVADTSAVPECSDADFTTILSSTSNLCPPETALGAATVTFKEPVYVAQRTETVPVFNLAPALGEPARFGFEFDHVPVTLDTSIKTGAGYEAEVKAAYTPQAAEVMSTILTVWGVPGDAHHNSARGWQCLGHGHYVESLEESCPELEGSQLAPYLDLPTLCGNELETTARVQSWVPEAPLEPAVKASNAPTLQGCGRLPFEPAISVAPDQHETSTPSGLNVEVTVPQATTLSAGGLDEADIKDTTMTLPEGLPANAGSANGLETCGVGETGFMNQEVPALNGDTGSTLEKELGEQRFTSAGVTCPDASKIGEVSVRTPLLEHELTGFVYMGEQDTDPFTSPLVLYLIAEDPVSGVLVKLAGEIQISETGQITSVFKETPPLPFESLKVHLFDGPRASQATPAYCRPYETKASFVPSSGGADAQASSSFTPQSGPNGTSCQEQGPLPFAPSQQAGVTNNQAAGFTPFTLTIGRPDGDQALERVEMELPPGVAALISEVPLCSEEQAEANACPATSLVGHTVSESGLGGDPVTLGGQLYLTGALKATSKHGASPFGLLAVTHAKAGPFDLGYVKVLSTINVNENTAQAIVKSEPLPKILDGVPVQLKAINVTVERPEGKHFEFNPTNCSPLTIKGTLTGYEGASHPISEPFEVANCATLPFAPKLTATTGAHGSKVNGSYFDVTVESAGLGQAGIHKLDLTLPEALPSRLTTIQKACLAAVFEANPASCDEGSMIGEGIVHTPVFKNPLRGPAYLVSHGNAAFPDVEFVLQGEGVTLVIDGKTDIKKGITYSKFETNPDAPFTKFESIFPTGPHSALTVDTQVSATYDLCGKSLTMPTEITGQNGAFIKRDTKIGVAGCGGVLGFKVTKAQRLAKALKACRKKYKGSAKKSKRIVCEKAAHKKYGSKAKKASKKHAQKK